MASITTATKKITELIYQPTRYKVIQGGMSAGKTYAILEILIGYAESYPDSLVTIVGMTYRHLDRGAMRDFKKIMQEQGRWDGAAWNGSKMIYSFVNGSQIEFLALDKMTSRGLRRDVLYVNEANGITYETFKQLADRTRDFSIIDYNPSAKFWAHTELVEKKKDETSFIILTYKDNEALSAQEVKNIEENRPKEGEEPSNYWIVYGLGQIGSLEGNIYSGWEEASEDVIEKGQLVRYGLDFGFANDQTALVAVYKEEDGKTGLIEKYYEKGLLPSQYVDMLRANNIDPETLIVADSARPEIIAEIKAAGFRIIPCEKGAGSIKRGIDRVQEQQIIYAGSNLKREFYSYQWKKRADGESTGEPQDGNDHIMDALRYAIDDLYRPRFDF